jgi:hypothetical protein
VLPGHNPSDPWEVAAADAGGIKEEAGLLDAGVAGPGAQPPLVITPAGSPGPVLKVNQAPHGCMQQMCCMQPVLLWTMSRDSAVHSRSAASAVIDIMLLLPPLPPPPQPRCRAPLLLCCALTRWRA